MTNSPADTARDLAISLGHQLNAVVTIFEQPPHFAEGPLHEVPVAVKDIIDIAGHPRGNGNPEAMDSAPARIDAPVIAMLRALGADIFAATSLLEYAAGAIHPLVPETRNPFDQTRTAGGSSGGSAALVGAGVCSVALGTDTGGSIRIPAHYCGTVGFKPSYGALPLDGVEPLSPTLDHVGLLTDTVATANRVFHAMTRPSTKINTPVVSCPLRVGVIPEQLISAKLSDDVHRKMQETVDILRSRGCTIIEVDGSALEKLHALFGEILLFEAWEVHGERVKSHPHHYGPATLQLLLSAEKVNHDTYAKAIERRQELLPAAERVYEGIDVLLSPAAPFVAPKTTPPVDTSEGDAEGMFTAVFNLTGDPALVLPCGWSQTGLPIGAQLSAPFGSDDTLLAAAEYIESILSVDSHSPIIDRIASPIKLRPFLPTDYREFAGWFPTLDDFYLCSGQVEDWPVTDMGLAKRAARNDVLSWTAVLAVDSSTSVGHIEFVRTDSRTGRFARVLIAPEFRRQGLGKKLIECGISAVRDLGVHRITLNVVKGNEPALNLYISDGFHVLEAKSDRPDSIALTRTI